MRHYVNNDIEARRTTLEFIENQYTEHLAAETPRIVQANLNAGDGTVTARNTPGDKCPNCNSPLWRVTERDAGRDLMDNCETLVDRAKNAEARAEQAEAIVKAAEEETDAEADITFGILNTPEGKQKADRLRNARDSRAKAVQAHRGGGDG